MNGRDDTTTFLTLDFRTGGPSEDSHSTVGQYFTRDQTRHVYKKVETGESINADTIQQEVAQEKQLNKLDDESGEENPYRELIINNAEIQHSQLNSMNHSLDIKPVNRYKTQSNDSHSPFDKEFREVDLVKIHKVCRMSI